MLAAALVPLFVSVAVYVRSVAGGCVPEGLTPFEIVRLGRTTVRAIRPTSLCVGPATERAVKVSVSSMPAATFPTE